MKGNFIWPRGAQWLWVAGLGLFALAAQMLMTWALQHANSLIVSFLMYSEILFHALFGWFFWNEVLSSWSWFGGALIVIGSVMLLVFKPKGLEQAADTHHEIRDKKQ